MTMPITEVIILPADIYNSFFLQILLFICLSAVLLISAISLFIKPAKRTIRARLVEASTGHIVDISRAETSIGRAKTCALVISDLSVSRFLAVLSKRKSGWIIFDTNSPAGVKVNGKKIDKKTELKDGDALLFGKTEYVFYSTAVTTRQQVVPKTKKPTADERPKYRKNTNTSDETVYYEKKTKTR